MKGKTSNRILSVFLAAAVMVSVLPANAFAQESELPASDEIVIAAEAEESLDVPVGDEADTPPSHELKPEKDAAETGTDSAGSDGAVAGDGADQTDGETSGEEADEVDEEIGETAEALLTTAADDHPLDALAALAAKTGDASVSVDGKQITVDAGGLILLSNTDMDFTGYTIFLSTLGGVDADLTRTITINDQTYTFQGLGTDEYPFSGMIESQETTYGVIANVPFFKAVDVSEARFAILQTLKIKSRSGVSALLAETISGAAGDSWNTLAILAEKDSRTEGGTATEYLPGGLIGTMAAGASLSLGTVTYSAGANVSSASSNAGLLCNTMSAGSSLSVKELAVSSAVTVTANGGAAGGLVGLMESGAGLTVGYAESAVTIDSNYTITGNVAGGLIGSGAEVRLGGAKATINGATVQGSAAAGGLIGSYSTGEAEDAFTAYDGSESSNLKVALVNLQDTAGNACAGGLFGTLGLSSDFTISNASVRSAIAGKKANYGGLIGQVKGDCPDSLRALTICGTTSPTTGTTVELSSYAGAVSIVGNDENSPVYVKIAGELKPTTAGLGSLKASEYFGSVAAHLQADSVIEIAEGTVVAPTGCTNIVCGGGVLGNAAKGSTLCLAGTTDLRNTAFANTNSATGQIVGTQESALIYAKSDWTFIRQATPQPLDDIGSYGEVIRLGGNMGMGVASDSAGLSSNLIAQDTVTHKTTFSAVRSDLVTTADGLALIAIEEQTGHALNGDITFGADISLAHTGIIGVQRDIDVGYAYAGTLDGGGHTLTVAAGEIYGFRGENGTVATKDTVGSGQIHGHSQVGFFSQANGTVKNLTVDGEMNLCFRGDYTAGGLVAKNPGAGIFEGVTSRVKINCQGTNGGSVGGLVGVGASLTISGCTGAATIDIGNSAVYAGGLIGNYTGTALTIRDTTLSGTMMAKGAAEARLGGLVSRIAAGSYSEVTVTLTNVTVSGQTITSDASKTCGGLLGYEWNNAKVFFGDKNTHSKGVTVKALTVTGEDGKTETRNSAVCISGNAEGAGLVYTATGYWQLNDLNLDKLTVTSGNGDLGLLICRGWKRDSAEAKPYLLYVEETNYQAFGIGDVTVTNAGGWFDEWVVRTCDNAGTITANGNSVISIATPDGTKVEGLRAGVDPAGTNCTSYQNRTTYGKTSEPNPNARYYYDLDVIRETVKASKDGYLNTPGELVLWAVWRYAEEKTDGKSSNIQDYFAAKDIGGSTMDGGGASIDLTGYSYYPITVNGFSLNVKDITIQFANQEIETAEGKTGETLDSLNRTTAGTPESHSQHYLMHSGLLLNYQNSSASADVTMTVSGVTIRGTIGNGPDGGSGALICGQLGGRANTAKYSVLSINGLTLGGACVNADKTADGYAPLLVNRVGSYTSLSVQQVSAVGYSSGILAATSLIGHVGNEYATNISLAFSNGIDLSGRKSDSIFSRATLLESFRYQTNASGYYHFNQGEACTYGWEINNAIEYKDLQLKYYDQSCDVTDEGNKDFTNYLPYVCHPYTNDDDKYHELEINVPSPNLTEGCGTYDDPYLISTARQLQFAAQFINGGEPQGGWKVNKVENGQSVKTEWNENHAMHEVGNNWDNNEMRTYLLGAYYRIEADLDLSNFPGFGSGTYPFMGVIEGNGATVRIAAATNESGLINVSCGSVVRNLTIAYIGTKRFDGVVQPDDKSNEVPEKSYFGGIIGTVKGGDSLIEAVTVQFLDGFTIATSDDRQCAGGFVGLIQGGGVVFRNMGGTAQNPGYTGTGSTYYVDKYIGRVLDGYAIYETEGEGVTFAGKNYSIANISSETALAWNNGDIAIGNAQQMILLTDIINSGAASGGQSPAYSSQTKTRNGDYSLIGNISDASNAAFAASRRDDTIIGTGNYPYLIAKYAENAGAFWTACTDAALTITFSENAEIDLSAYGNGYRGIGGRYHCTANGGDLTYNTPMISAVTGNGVSIKVANDIAEYRADNFYANAVGGLFNVFRHEGATISNLNVSGTVKVCSGLGETGDVESTDYLVRAPVGGIIGKDFCSSASSQTLTLTKVSFGTEATPKSEVYGESVTGGFIGSSGSKKHTAFDKASYNKTILSMTDCGYQNVTIVGGICTGGFVGSTVWNSDEYALFGESNRPDRTMEITWTDSAIVGGKNAIIRNLFCASGGTTTNGVGGVIGFCSIPFNIAGIKSQMTTFDNVELYGGKANKRGRIGGLIGFVVNNVSSGTSRTISWMKLCNMTVGATASRYSSTYDDNAGIIVGTWYASSAMTITNCVVEDSSVQANSSGGVVGWGGNGGNIVVRNIRLTNTTLPKRGGTNVGTIGGQISINFYGHNILIQDANFLNMSTGRFFGTGTNARLLGVTIQQDNGKPLPEKDIYNVAYTAYGTKNYVVYAGYKSSGSIESAGDIAVKPSITIPGVGDLHGDTVTPEIVCNAVNDADTYYQNLADAGVIKDKFTENIRSTYNVHQDNDLTNDFPVLLIDGDASVLRQYLNAATNGGFDSMRSFSNGSKIKVELARYVKVEGADTFSKADPKAYPATLIYHSATGEFTTTAQFDNQKDTFTLITVTMTGYSSSDKFVLHIPVIVRRMLQVDFMATMTSGTVFNKTDDFYYETRNHALASAGESITGYLTFHYNSNASDADNPASYDWKSYMEAGGNLLGYYKKTADTGTNPLPAGTQITLIDCQNGDRRYYAEVQGAETYLELFNGGNLTFTTSTGEEFAPAALADLLQITAETATEAEKTDTSVIKWVKLDSAEGATVKSTDGSYFRLYDAATDTAVTDLFTLTVGNVSPRENYFVVISVPNKENHRLTLYKSGMVWSDDSTASPPLEVHQVHRYDPSKANYEPISEASFNYLDNYQQTLTDNTITENVQVLATNAKVELPICVTSAVCFDSKNYTDTDPLYQKFVISLKKTVDGVKAGIGLPSDAVAVEKAEDGGTSAAVRENAVKLYAYCVDASGNRHYYVWNGSAFVDSGTDKVPAASYAWSGSADSAEMELPFAQKTADGYRYIDLAGLRKASGNQFYLEVETTLELSVASVLSNNTIPYDSASGEISNYTQVDAASVLSFTESGLSYSTLRGSTNGRTSIRKYYLNTARNAVLKLEYTNIDQLGINAREDTAAVIDTVLTLDFSNMEGFTSDVGSFITLREADTVTFTLSLKKKGGSGYDDVSINHYLPSATISDGTELTDYTIALTKNADGSYPYYHEKTGKFIIPISFAVNMDVREYANYRIFAAVALRKEGENQNLEINQAGAYLTYTYAKINVNGYWNQLAG